MEIQTKKKKLDKLDIAYQQKIFFKTLYGDLTGEGGNLEQGQYIRIFQNNVRNTPPLLQGQEPGEQTKELNIVKFYNNVDDLVRYCSGHTYDKNTYFTLSTTNGESGQEKDLKYRSVIAFDFDKKDLGADFSYKDIMERFKSLGLWYHCITDSGNGYHVYVCIEPTEDLDKVQEVQKTLCERLGADANAIKSTQILRIPYTWNIKNKPRMVKIIKMFSRDTIKRYSIDKLYSRYCNSSFKDTGDRLSQYNLKNTNIPLCVKKALAEGSEDGFKNIDLYNIIMYLKHKGENIGYIKKVSQEWNNKNNTKMGQHELDYQIEYSFKNCNGYRCDNCKYNKVECKNYTESDFNLEQYGENILNIHTKIGRQCRNSSRKGVISLTGNELFIYNVLLNNTDIQLNIDGLIELITDRKNNKVALSINTIREALLGLEEKGYITITKGNKKLGIKDTYSIIDKKNIDTNNINISYFINIAVIWGRITTNELKCYVRMRYLHNQAIIEGKAKGNIFTITMRELAEDLGYKDKDHAVVSRMIKNLYENNILDRRAIPMQNNPKQFYYQYKLNM